MRRKTVRRMPKIGYALAWGEVNMEGWTIQEKQRAIQYASRVLAADYSNDPEELAVALEDVHEQCGWPYFPPWLRRIMEDARKAATERRGSS